MLGEISISNGVIFRQSNGKRTSATAAELWAAKKLNPEAYENIQILGLAQPSIFVFVNKDGESALEVQAKTDARVFSVGFFRPQNLDYLVSASTVVPLKAELFSNLFDSLEKENVYSTSAQLETLVSVAIKVSTSLSVPLEISPEVYMRLEEAPPANLELPMSKELWGYQKVGVAWMFRLWKLGLGGILGDEMGVGKTLQLLALVCKISMDRPGKPALIVVPGNLLLKWCRDFLEFAEPFVPTVQVHSGSHRSRDPRFLAKQRIILTTYSMLVEDESIFGLLDFSVIACDEAHEIREGRTLRSKAISKMRSEAKFLATGTPIQNRLMDYWTLVDIVAPGLLGDKTAFETRCTNSPQEAKKLMQQTKHKILRRTQDQVSIEIPPGTEMYVPLEMSPYIKGEYAAIKYGASEYVESASGFAEFAQLRQFCANPGSIIESLDPAESSKAVYLLNQLDAIFEAGEKAVVFVADFNKPRDLYLQLVRENFPSIWTGTIDGRIDVEFRHVLLETFTNVSGCAVLFVNPQVGGQGLDMVAANHVFHMNPAWNPAKTDQASFRVTRPGQTRETWSHHLYFENSIEESIYKLVSQKREMSEAALLEAENDADRIHDDLISVFGKKYMEGKIE